jgi:hypothetical protein
LSTFDAKAIVLPRQARDKHSASTQTTRHNTV